MLIGNGSILTANNQESYKNIVAAHMFNNREILVNYFQDALHKLENVTNSMTEDIDVTTNATDDPTLMDFVNFDDVLNKLDTVKYDCIH